jgi:hypothetical protein
MPGNAHPQPLNAARAFEATLRPLAAGGIWARGPDGQRPTQFVEAGADNPACGISLTLDQEPHRGRSGTVETSPAFLSAIPVKRPSIPVSFGPGATALTRTPEAATSSAADLVSPSTGCSLAE